MRTKRVVCASERANARASDSYMKSSGTLLEHSWNTPFSMVLRCGSTPEHSWKIPEHSVFLVESAVCYMKSSGTLLEHSWNTPFSLVLRCGNTPEHSWKIPEHSVFFVESAIYRDLNIIILNGGM